MDHAPVSRGRGRPRGFDEREALDAATRCFWSLGYDRASIAVLCDAMAMSRASLYAEYGDKDGLFLAALDHYAQTYSAPALAALAGKRETREELQGYFEGVINLVTGDPNLPGCLIVCVLSEAATAHPKYQALLAHKTDALEARIARTLRAASVPETEEVLRAKAGMLAATARGLAISARAGIPAARLRAVAQMATGLACQPSQAQ